MPSFFFFFFNDTATTEIYTLSLHDALPISSAHIGPSFGGNFGGRYLQNGWHTISRTGPTLDRKSTRLNSSHANISYAVFCLKKKKKYQQTILYRHAEVTRRCSHDPPEEAPP